MDQCVRALEQMLCIFQVALWVFEHPPLWCLETLENIVSFFNQGSVALAPVIEPAQPSQNSKLKMSSFDHVPMSGMFWKNN